jgi:hypothetical protein
MFSTNSHTMKISIVMPVLFWKLLVHPVQAQVCPKTWQCLPTTTAPTLDGNLNEWVDVSGIESSLKSSITGTYFLGTAAFKCQYDDTNIYMAMEIPGLYQFNATDDHFCAAIATMIKVGVDASFVQMGNCPDAGPGSECSDTILEACDTYRVDIGAHWELSGTEQSVFYNLTTTATPDGEKPGNDLVANKDDEWAVSSWCRFDDNDSNGGNEWSGSWVHTNPIVGEDGNYIFELSRLLQTPSTKTDAQLKAGEVYSVGLAYWDPYETELGWSDAGHYVTGCGTDWIELELVTADTLTESDSSSGTTSNMLSLAMLLSSGAAFAAVL